MRKWLFKAYNSLDKPVMKTPKKTANVKTVDDGARKYSGVAIDVADSEKTSVKLEKERTKTLNNNPRNDDM